MKDIAEKAGVSLSTVSKILNGNDRYISEATRTKVLQIVKETNYVPNAVARGLKVQRTNTIGFILPDISNPFFPEIARGIEAAAEVHGFALVLCDTDNDPKREQASFNLLKSKKVDGLILTRVLQHSALNELVSRRLPIVVVDRRVNTTGRDIGRIIVDTRSAMRDITKLLLARGSSRIAFIGAQDDFEDARYNGYCDALAGYGLKADPMLSYRGTYTVETGHTGVRAIFSHTFADGLVCGNDLIAVGAINELKALGLRVPEDVRVTGFDDIYLARYLSPPLTTVQQPAYEMGRTAADMLIRNILFGDALCTNNLGYKIIERESAL